MSSLHTVCVCILHCHHYIQYGYVFYIVIITSSICIYFTLSPLHTAFVCFFIFLQLMKSEAYLTKRLVKSVSCERWAGNFLPYLYVFYMSSLHTKFLCILHFHHYIEYLYVFYIIIITCCICMYCTVLSLHTVFIFTFYWHHYIH